MSLLTQTELKRLLDYNPSTGLFTWKISRPNAKQGNKAGNLDPSGYIRISVNSKNYTAHRLAFLYMTGNFPLNHTDHINHNRSDNRWINLRLVTQKENNRNLAKRSDNTSGTSGVSFSNKNNKWIVRIKVENCYKSFGAFPTIEEAISIRNQIMSLHGYHSNHGKEKQCNSI